MNWIASGVLAFAALSVISVCLGDVMSLELSSPAFTEGGSIPARYTCDGDDLSPALSWTGVPPGTESLALIVDDPDAPDPAAPKRTWVHWVIYNLPPDTTALPEAADVGSLPAGARNGKNDWQRIGYGGPCPPVGRHRYFFKLYALDTRLPELANPDKKALERAIQGHVLAESVLMGTYSH